MIITIIISVIVLLLAMAIESIPSIGENNGSFFHAVLDRWKLAPLVSWHKSYKDNLTKLSQKGFQRMKMRGTRPIQHSQQKASRGYDKLMEILMSTRIKLSGRVLSLCCGAGGWEQAIANNPDITDIRSVTFGAGPGHVGHKNFTSKPFPGRHKVKLAYTDARTYPITHHDVLLFDGGESRKDPENEVRSFRQLFNQTVMRQIKSTTQHFILKVLVPTDPEIIGWLKEIQSITGKGSLVRSSHSRASNLECYFVSLPKFNVEESVKICLRDAMQRGLDDIHLQPRKYGPGYEYYRDEVGAEILEPLDMSESIKQCGQPLPAEAKLYNHWEALGVFPFGSKGSKGMKYNNFAMDVLRLMVGSLPGFDKWRLTDTTPNGFQGVFRKKIDNPPLEDHPYLNHMSDIYEGMAEYFIRRGFKYKELSEQAMLLEVNKQGAPGFQDVNYNNTASFLSDPRWRKIVKKHEIALLAGKPIGGIFNTMAKREKKKMKTSTVGSRMVAFLPIPMRLLELRTFGCLLNLTKKEWNRFGVGGLGLHDLGMRMNEAWVKFIAPGGCSSDIAGFDTRVGCTIQNMECKFIMRLGGGELVKKFYQLYSHPLITIPIPGDLTRSELLGGRGQRMSGSHVTYTMNTITRIVLMILQAASSKNRLGDVKSFTLEMMQGKHLAGCVSGDDEVTIGESADIKMMNKHAWILHDVGFPRKDTNRDETVTISRKMEELDFCSHQYVKITYYDEDSDTTAIRWAPTRDMTEIMAKATIRLGTGDELSDEAWLSAQGNQLLVNYHHLRTARAAGLAFKAIVNPYLLLTDRGGFIKPTPWMRDGDILNVINTVLFGESTQYPIPGFKVRRFSHLGYIKFKEQDIYDPDFHKPHRQRWRAELHRETERVIYERGTHGDPTILDRWKARELY